MTSRERVKAAINHQCPDQIPLDIGGTFASGFTARAYDRIREFLGIPVTAANIINDEMMLIEPETAIRKAMGIDTISVYAGGGHYHGWQDWTMPDGTQVKMSSEIELRPVSDGGWKIYRGGKLQKIMPPNGYYFDSFEWPKWRDVNVDDYTDEILGDLQFRCAAAHEDTDLAVILNVPFTIFNGTNTDFLCALYTEKEEAHERIGIWMDHNLEAMAKVFDAAAGNFDVVAFSGDAGTQTAPLIGPEVYDEMLLPHFKRVTDFVHQHTDAAFFYHTCGSVYKLIPSFIKLGIDALNPLQVTATDMEAQKLVPEFGGKLVFWGGGIDAQHTLTHGSEEEIRAKVRSQLSHYTSQPGFVFAFDHNIQPDIPPENVMIALDEMRRFQVEQRLFPGVRCVSTALEQKACPNGILKRC